MKGLIDFFEEQLNKKINIYEYKDEMIDYSDKEIVLWNNNKYIIEIIEDNIDEYINGYCYLIYQNKLNKDLLDEILKQLYKDIKLYKYKNNYILKTNKSDLIDNTTPQIIETETYAKTYILNLGKVKDKSELESKVDLVNELKKLIFMENTDRKYFDICDLGLYNLIKNFNKDKLFSSLFDYRLIEKLDNVVLETGIGFIESGFNIAKASNNMYLHRNTLIYRLDKIKDVLNLDIKKFNEACIYYFLAKNHLLNKSSKV